MKRLCHAILTGILLSLAAPVAAKGILYDCDITQRKKDVDWISPKLAIIVEESGQVQVVDSIILYFVEKPVTAKVRKRGDVLRLNWTLAGAVDGLNQNIPQFGYAVKLNTKTLKVDYRANPVGFPQNFSGKGTCKVKTK